MEKELLRINLLVIALTGGLVFLTGLGLYFVRAHLGSSMRFILPIPPLGVAVYVFVFNLFRHYNGSLPLKISVIMKEVLSGTLVAAIVFGGLSLILILVMAYLNQRM